LAAFWFTRQGRPWAAGLAGFGAGLTRVQGAFLVLPLAFEYVRRRDEEAKRPGLGLLASTLPPLGLIAATAYQHLVVGEHRSPVQVAAPWGRMMTPPWDVLSASWRHIARTGDPIEVLNVLCLAGFGLLALGMIRRLPLMYALYVWPALALPLVNEWYVSPLAGVCRFTLVLFPCFLMLALWLSRHLWLAASYIILGAILQILLFDYWVHFGFVA
jgi:hypothetical protein